MTERIEHTPGPWRVECDPSHYDTASNVVGGLMETRAGIPNQMFVSVGGWSEFYEQEANARLIAAAPKMLEALRKALPHLDNSGSPGGCNGKHPDCEHCAAIAFAHEAISDAVGEKTAKAE